MGNNPAPLEVKVGTYLAKDGTFVDQGWTEYSPISVVMVMSRENGVVTLNCPPGHLSWWGCMDIANLSTIVKNPDKHKDNHPWLASVSFKWSEVDVHTVLVHAPNKQMLRNKRLKMQKLIKRGVRLFGPFWNFRMYVFVAKRIGIIACT